MDDKPSAAEQAAEIARRIYEDELSMGGAEEAIESAITDATERTARRCMEICKAAVPRAHTYASENADIYHAGDAARDRCIDAIAKEFGLE